VFVPKITSPASTTEWTAGTVATVTWTTDDAPARISNRGHVVLQHDGQLGTHLAGPFDLVLGKVEFTLPKDLASGTYKIVLFGNSGNESPAFWIHGLENTREPASNSSEGHEDQDNSDSNSSDGLEDQDNSDFNSSDGLEDQDNSDSNSSDGLDDQDNSDSDFSA